VGFLFNCLWADDKLFYADDQSGEIVSSDEVRVQIQKQE